MVAGKTLLLPQLRVQPIVQTEEIVLWSIVVRKMPDAPSLVHYALRADCHVDGFCASHLLWHLCTYLPQLGEFALGSAASGT